MIEKRHLVQRPFVHILVIQTAFIGDVVLTTPLFRAVKENAPEATIDVVVTPQTSQLLIDNPYIRHILCYDKRGNDKGFIRFFKLVKILYKRDYDVALLPHRSLRSALLTRFANIPVRVGFDVSPGSPLYTKRIRYRKNVHETIRNLDLLSPFGMNSADSTPQLFVNPGDQQKVRDFLKAQRIKEDHVVVGMAPGSVWPTKRWTPEGFADVADRLKKRKDAEVLLFGGTKDVALCHSISSMMEKTPVITAGTLSLKESAALIARCQVFLTNDTGLMHVAAALQVPVVAIFGATVPSFGFTPCGNNHTIVERSLPCRPCGIHGKKKCKEGTFACMKQIHPEDVYEAIVTYI